MSSLNALRTELSEEDLDRKLIFATVDGEIGAGYHITELKLADVQGIDCGANQRGWRETVVQLLDGHGRAHMSVGKFAAIVDQSVKAVPGLGDAPVRIEFAPRNQGLHLYEIGGAERTEDALIVGLVDDRATCKPAGLNAGSAGEAACC